MKNKKGFTLIELLAVIVILSVIALIAIPKIVGVLEKTKKSSAIDSTYGFVEAINTGNKFSEISSGYEKIEDGTYDVVDIVDKVKFKGKAPLYGEITISKGIVTSAELTMNGYKIGYDGNKATVLGKDKEEKDIQPMVIQITNVSTTTSKIIIPFTISSDTKIRNIECLYKLTSEEDYISTNVNIEDTKSEDQTGSIGTCKITKLYDNKEYDYKIKVKDQINITEKTGSATTVLMATPTITYVNNDEVDWKSSKVVRFNGGAIGATLQYRIITREDESEHDTGWVNTSDGYEYTLDKKAVDASTITNIYVRLIDEAEHIKQAEVRSQTHIDTTPPTLVLGEVEKTSKTITIPITVNTDPESNIANTTCIYGETASYELGSITISDNKCVIPNAVEGKTYYYKIETENGAGVKVSKTGNNSSIPLEDCSISITDENTWKASKTATITGATTGAHLEYSMVVASDTTKNVGWTEISSGEVITLNNMATSGEPTSVYCRMTDGVNTKNGSSSKTQTHIDITGPTSTGPSVTSTTTKTIVISNNQADSESLLDTSTLEYGISEDNSVYEWQNNGTFTDLKDNKLYYFKTRVRNNAGTQTTSNYVTERTGEFSTCDITIANATTWTTSKTATISGATTGADLEYSIVVESDTSKNISWTKYENAITLNNMATGDKPTTVYCRFNDGKNISGQISESTTHIDTTAPDQTAPSTVPDTESITVTNNQRDDESDVTAIEYGISETENGTYTYQVSNVFKGLTKGKDYYIKTRVNNNARVNSNVTEKIESTARKTTTKEITPPTIAVDNNNWAASHIFTAGYTKGEITNAYYYIRSTVASTLKTNTTIKACTSLSGTTKDCSGTNVSQNGTLTANTWYQVSVTSLQVELSDNGSVYVAVSDGTNLLDTPIATTSKVDKIPPVVTANGSVTTTTSTASVPITVTDNEIGTISSVTCEYKKNTDTNYVTTNTTGTSTGCSYTKLLTGQTYNYRITATDTLGNTTTIENALSNNFTTTNINQPTTALNITTNTTSCSKNRTITVYGAIEGAKLQYRIGASGTWTDIAHGGTFTTTVNDTIYAKLTDNTNETASTDYKTLTLTKNGDTTPVGTTAPTTSNITINSVTVTNKQTDNCSIGTIYYAIKKSGGSYGSWQTSNSFTGLDPYTTYYVKTKANDVAGNGEKESSEASFTTSKPTAADVSYTKNGQTTVDGALDDLFSKNP